MAAVEPPSTPLVFRILKSSNLLFAGLPETTKRLGTFGITPASNSRRPGAIPPQPSQNPQSHSAVGPQDNPISFDCLHCHSTVQGAADTNCNLYSHRDGCCQKGRSAVGCPKQREAKLPPTIAEVLKTTAAKNPSKIIPSIPFPIVSSIATIAEEEEYHPKPAGETQDNGESECANNRISYAICKITGAAPWRQKFKVIAMEQGLDVLELIAGYGIQWNIKYRARAYNARKVINQMLKEEYDKHASKNARSHRSKKAKSRHFKGILFDPSNWCMIKELNDKLEGGEVFKLDAEDTNTALIWWKEREGKYPILSPWHEIIWPAWHCLCRENFLSSSGCLFRKLREIASRIIEMCVSSRMWLKEYQSQKPSRLPTKL
ncbi:hypothetical protein H4Q26_002899 [Puccinia striiformis f. sp. tritici PST-130]|nr:hypothetical protein H4Q26_002899 [Puccinia striiformis f. sp. tritici PST-130]